MKPPVVSSLFSSFDLHLFGEGNHNEIYKLLGAHVRTVNETIGTNFAVWAPAAAQVAVTGSFSNWDARENPMQRVGTSGIWERFIPRAKPGDLYKFEVTAPGGHRTLKSDPFAFASEVPPRTASIVTESDTYRWRDDFWLECRSRRKSLDYPMSIYEVHLGSWQTRSNSENGWMNYREIAPLLIDYCKRMGFTHIELMPITEHPYTGSWGYQTVGYFATTSRYGSPQDFMYFVDQFHQNGIGVIADWVPAHFPRDAHGLARFDGTPLYEHADSRLGEHPDWGTLIFNYGKNEVRNFLVANALFWCDQFHIDGLRVDAVASMLYLDYSREEGRWVPNKYGGKENLDAIRLIKQVNEQVHTLHPGVLMIAEESTSWPGVSHSVSKGGLGFDLKWNMGWMNDTLRYMHNHPAHRKYHHDQLTFSMVYSYSENFMLPFSHDEVVHGKGSLIDQMPGDPWQKFANLRVLYTYMWAHPGKKLLFMGNEFAQWIEWNCERSLAWDLLKEPAHQGVQRLVRDLNRLLQHHPPMYEQDFVPAGFQWIDCHDKAKSTLSWIRRARDPNDFLVVACNFTPQPQLAHRIGVPQAGRYVELLNSDLDIYGGSGMGNANPILAADGECNGYDHFIVITLPPLAALILQPESTAKN